MALESPTINNWLRTGREQGEVATRRADLLRLIQMRCKATVPDSIRRAVEGTTDMGKLTEWFDLAAVTSSLAKLRRAIKEQEPEADAAT